MNKKKQLCILLAIFFPLYCLSHNLLITQEMNITPANLFTHEPFEPKNHDISDNLQWKIPQEQDPSSGELIYFKSWRIPSLGSMKNLLQKIGKIAYIHYVLINIEKSAAAPVEISNQSDVLNFIKNHSINSTLILNNAKQLTMNNNFINGSLMDLESRNQAIFARRGIPLYGFSHNDNNGFLVQSHFLSNRSKYIQLNPMANQTIILNTSGISLSDYQNSNYSLDYICGTKDNIFYINNLNLTTINQMKKINKELQEQASYMECLLERAKTSNINCVIQKSNFTLNTENWAMDIGKEIKIINKKTNNTHIIESIFGFYFSIIYQEWIKLVTNNQPATYLTSEGYFHSKNLIISGNEAQSGFACLVFFVWDFVNTVISLHIMRVTRKVLKKKVLVNRENTSKEEAINKSNREKHTNQKTMDTPEKTSEKKITPQSIKEIHHKDSEIHAASKYISSNNVLCSSVISAAVMENIIIAYLMVGDVSVYHHYGYKLGIILFNSIQILLNCINVAMLYFSWPDAVNISMQIITLFFTVFNFFNNVIPLSRPDNIWGKIFALVLKFTSNK
jgi:hypothetical protein